MKILTSKNKRKIITRLAYIAVAAKCGGIDSTNLKTIIRDITIIAYTIGGSSMMNEVSDKVDQIYDIIDSTES